MLYPLAPRQSVPILDATTLVVTITVDVTGGGGGGGGGATVVVVGVVGALLDEITAVFDCGGCHGRHNTPITPSSSNTDATEIPISHRLMEVAESPWADPQDRPATGHRCRVAAAWAVTAGFRRPVSVSRFQTVSC